MEISIDCPIGGDRIAVTPGGSGGGTICAFGSVFEKFRFPPPAPLLGVFARVIVIARPVGSGSGMPTPDPTLGGTDAGFVAARWCAREVPVPGSSAAGDPMIAFAWLMSTGSGGGGPTPIGPPQSAEFLACTPGSGVKDCCALGPCSGGSAMAQNSAVASALAGGPALDVSVPDGPNAGIHPAAPVARLAWSAKVGRAEYHISYCETNGLVVRCGGTQVPAEAVESAPFSATFPGTVFEAAGEVVVTVA